MLRQAFAHYPIFKHFIHLFWFLPFFRCFIFFQTFANYHFVNVFYLLWIFDRIYWSLGFPIVEHFYYYFFFNALILSSTIGITTFVKSHNFILDLTSWAIILSRIFFIFNILGSNNLAHYIFCKFKTKICI